MGLNAKSALLIGLALLGVAGPNSNAEENVDNQYLTIGRMEVREISQDVLNQQKSTVVYEKVNGLDDFGRPSNVDPRQIIAIARELVALGEEIYTLVDKGRPHNTIEYTPISVLPKDARGGPVNAMDTEGWRMPLKKTYEVLYENLYGMEVVKFRYSVIFSYGGSYDGNGAYLTAVQIVPESVSTMFGFDFSATMKLSGIQNQGSRMDPVAAATIQMEYTVKNVLRNNHEVRTFFVTGKGGFKAY